jgi:hypothetical protein
LALMGASLACGVVAAAAVGACAANTTTTGFTPITGIIIRSESLVAGKGCGTAPGQVYRYLAIVTYAPDDLGTTRDPIAGAVFDCFADGLFSNLQPAPDTGSVSYVVTIYAYDAPSYPAADLQCYVDQTCAALPGACDATKLHALYTTTCTATQQQGIAVLADCNAGDAGLANAGEPLAPLACNSTCGASKIAIPTDSFPLVDGGTIKCGANADYDEAFAFFAPEGGLPGQTPITSCGPPITIETAQPCTTYGIQVELQNSHADGGPAVVASARCSAKTWPTLTANASCSPATHP